MKNNLFFKEDSIIISKLGKYVKNSEIRAVMTLSKEGWILRDENVEYKPEKEYTPCKSYEENVELQNFVNKAESLSPYVDKIIIRRIERKINECKEIKHIVVVEKDYLRVGGRIQYLDSMISYLQNEEKNVRRIIRDYQIGGRIIAILSPEVFGVIIAYVVKMLLRGDFPRLKLYEKTFPLTVIDNPLEELSPAFSIFDDEGVLTRTKEIIGDGNVEDYLGTLYTKYGNPGNARGIPPEPDYFTIEIKNGDWNLDEMREENKDGVEVYGVESVEIIENSIRITPKIIEKNGIGLKVREIAIPLQDLLSIAAVSKTTKPYAINESHGIVAPYVLMPVRVILF